ncbi:hypothetical protein JXA56_02330 [Candidatus Micrarchaeota archaeon]|nr:hypothetical protein [Candidatus Micrarchaeota archaeon]
MNHKKGQAVMEYLITYGLALFVILIVLAILVAVVLPSLQAPETCQFNQPGFGCSTKNHVLVSDQNNQVKLIFQLDNQQGKSVIITGVLCSSEATGDIRREDFDNGLMINKPMPSGSSISIGATGAEIAQEVICVDGAGNPVMLAAGSNFKGALAIKYKFSDEVPGAPERIAIATLIGNTQAN